MNTEQQKEKTGAELIAEERKRQIESEGWTIEHDDEHRSGELGLAGSCYESSALTGGKTMTHQWPWSAKWWKPKDALSDFVRAGALFLAESEKQIRLGDTVKADYWSKRAEIVGREIDRLNFKPMEQKDNRTAEQFNYFQNHGMEDGRCYTVGFGDPDEIEPGFVITGAEFEEDEAKESVKRLNEILSQQTAALREELQSLREENERLRSIIPSDEQLAIELVARYSRMGRGLDIAKQAFTDAVFWMRSKALTSNKE